jgi:hypothetical protein
VDELTRGLDDPLAVDAARAVLEQAREEFPPSRRSSASCATEDCSSTAAR